MQPGRLIGRKDIRPDLRRAAIERRRQLGLQLRLLRRAQMTAATLPVELLQRLPAARDITLVPATDGVVLQVENLRHRLAAQTVVEEQKRIGATPNAAPFARPAYKSQQPFAFRRAQEVSPYHLHS